MPVGSTSIVPQLIQELFAKYATNSCVVSVNSERGRLCHKQLFVELHTIFGAIVVDAVHILDQRRITFYRLETPARQIAEIRGERKSDSNIKLFSDVNFCPCDYFQSHVLNLKPEFLACAAATISSYTCAHVLAINLARLFGNNNAFCEETVSKQRFDLLVAGMWDVDADES